MNGTEEFTEDVTLPEGCFVDMLWVDTVDQDDIEENIEEGEYSTCELQEIVYNLFEDIQCLKEDLLLLKGYTQAKQDVKEGRVSSSEEFKEKLKLKKGRILT